ncbi:TadE/TadG family type IV pilus assembly protein [Szabonella alba]|uniref:Tad domain-containing protein n=1 Tax=Szabonella alba TaxID=2804194 RepID=A0A8K0V5X2_9RHOB|nr:TadE/TadG family type IV pilus assembly protein [Szabonella alba]MBL4916027.1 Tad domain-containing protein [Szabonella alba]
MMLQGKDRGALSPVAVAMTSGCRAMYRHVMRSLRQSLSQSLRRFSRDEDGVLLIFTMFLFLLMCMMGGVAVDLMRFEQQRTKMQQTLDRSVLAAASMTQRLDAEDVVNDYFTKAGMEQYLDEVEAPEGLNFRQVRARASADVPTFLMHLVGIDNLQAVAGSEAEQRITNVEVSMVLDVSRSMVLYPNQSSNPQKFQNLKDAATEFVETVLENDIEDRISISLVPYNGQVNLGPDLMDQYTVSHQHNYPNSHCLDLPQWTYNSHHIPTNTAFPQAGFFDSFTATTRDNRWRSSPSFTQGNGNFLNVWCQPIAANIIRPLQNDVGQLTGYINNLVAVGATSIDLGLKWGLNLLSPNSRQMVTNLRNRNIVPDEFDGRPLDFSAEDAMKVIVLMTDGEHFAFEALNDTYRSGNSDIWRSRGDGHLSVRPPGYNQYWVPHRDEWRSSPWNTGGGSATRLSWPEVWQDYPVQWVAWQLYARATGTNQYTIWLNRFRSQTPTNTMDNRLQDVCNLAKNNGIIIYGIAFELESSNGANQIRNCSTSESHFFDVEGLELRTAFRAIANNISQLRLTQ